MSFKKAQRKASKFKGSIQGASGSGKTFSALGIATELLKITDPGKRIAVIDAENSSEMYAPPFDFDADADFGTGAKLDFNYKKLLAKLEAARTAGVYGAVIIDSMTHFWKEAGGFTRMIDDICAAQRARGGKGDSFAAWKQVDPLYRELMTYIRQYPLHVILCIRAKQAYERSEDAKGKGALKKVGMEPEFREGFEFEMDAQFAIDQDHVMVPLKHRLGDVLDGKTFRNPGREVAELIAGWINAGAPGQETPVAPSEPPPANPGPTVAKAAPPPPPTFEEPAPNTEANPPTVGEAGVAPSEPPPPQQTPAEALIARIAVAASLEELQSIGKDVKSAVADKRVEGNGPDYKAISEAYAARQRELKAAA